MIKTKISQKVVTGNIFIAVLLILGTFFLYSCSRNPFDIKPIQQVVLTIHRLDTLLFEQSPEQVKKSIFGYFDQYPDIFELYTDRILRLGKRESRYFMDYLDLFLRHPDIRDSYDSTKAIFGNFSTYKRELEQAFSLLKTHIPDLPVPELYLVISGFNESLVLTDSAVIVSLDKFLGQQSFFYQKIGMPRYLRKRSNPDLIAVEIVRNWLASEYENKDSIKNLASEIIQQGKILYLMDAAFPRYSDAKKISYTNDEIIWAEKSEKHLWAYIIDQKLLFSTSIHEIKKFTGEAPFVGTFGQDSPGRIGAWIGWQIVRRFMQRNPDVTIQQLMKTTNNQQILLNSGYSPR